MIYSFVLCACLLISTSLSQETEGGAPSFPTNVQGNIGLQGSGYGDVYGGTVKEGVYGAGGRIGGGLNLLGNAGLGRRKRQSANAVATANATATGGNATATANAFANSAPAPAAEARRRRRFVKY